MGKLKIEVTKRTVYEGRRKRVVYDARHGNFEHTAHSKLEATMRVACAVDYCNFQQTVTAGFCKLEPVDLGSWSFTIRGKDCVYVFSAIDIKDAYAKVSGYREHPDCVHFFAFFDSDPSVNAAA